MATPTGIAVAVRQAASGYALRALPRQRTYTTSWDINHHPGVRSSRARLEQLLHPEFHEVGRSGRPYDRSTVIQFLAEQQCPPPVESGDFNVTAVAPGVALLTYRSAHRHEDGSLFNHTLRLSVWVHEGAGWQLRYHQGTPAARTW
jgi:hypothetical protein